MIHKAHVLLFLLGTVAVPHYAQYEGRELGKWVQTQRQLYKDGQLEQSRVDRLEAIGMAWVLNRGLPRDRHWETMYNELKRYKQQYGDCTFRVLVHGISIGRVGVTDFPYARLRSRHGTLKRIASWRMGPNTAKKVQGRHTSTRSVSVWCGRL